MQLEEHSYPINSHPSTLLETFPQFDDECEPTLVKPQDHMLRNHPAIGLPKKRVTCSKGKTVLDYILKNKIANT